MLFLPVSLSHTRPVPYSPFPTRILFFVANARNVWDVKRTLQVSQVALLVELGLVQAEGMHDIEDSLGALVDALISLLGRGVGANVNVLVADGDLLAVGLVDGAINLLEVVAVGDDLVARDDVLIGCERGQLTGRW